MDNRPEQTQAPVRVDASDILRDNPFPARELQPLERVAFQLAVALFSMIAIIIGAILIDWPVHRPAPPTMSGLKPEEQKAALDNFKFISEVLWDRTSKTFDLIIMKALLPVFATVVGYLLGKRTG